VPDSGHSNQQPSNDLNEEDFLDECKHLASIIPLRKLDDSPTLADLITIDDEIIIDNVSPL
jgi:hypothetical protein